MTPRGWQHTRLDSIASVERGRFSARPRNDTKYYGGDIPFLQTGDVSKSSGKITTFAQTLNELGLQVSKLFPRGTLLITIAANIGDVAEAEFDFACPDSLVAVRPNIGIDKDWLKYFLQGKKRHFESLATQNAQANINLQLIKPMEIELPPADEQRRIAAVLSTWDAAVAGMERIIEAKEKRKRALVQLLLFGKTRLGKCNTSCLNKYRWFSAPKEWNVVKIKSLAQEVIVRNSDGDGIPVLSCTKYRGLVDSLKYFDKQIFSKDTSAYKIIEYGQFAYATNHIEEGSIGYQDLYPKGLVSPMYTVFKTDLGQVNNGYLFKLLKTETFRQIFQIHTSASVDRRGSLRWKEFSNLLVPLPNIDEQNEINEASEIAQREVNLLRRKLELLKLQKRGLMQKLLSGKWRLKTGKEVS